jgi:hypothetical protein
MVMNPIEILYGGRCDIIEKVEVKDPVTKITKHQENVIITNQPCKLSFQKITAANQSEAAASVANSVKLFISPDIVIHPGSKIAVTQNGRTTEYQSSSEPAMYSSHQEVMLELFKGWS